MSQLDQISQNSLIKLFSLLIKWYHCHKKVIFSKWGHVFLHQNLDSTNQWKVVYLYSVWYRHISLPYWPHYVTKAINRSGKNFETTWNDMKQWRSRLWWLSLWFWNKNYTTSFILRPHQRRKHRPILSIVMTFFSLTDLNFNEGKEAAQQLPTSRQWQGNSRS